MNSFEHSAKREFDTVASNETNVFHNFVQGLPKLDDVLPLIERIHQRAAMIHSLLR